MDARNNSGKLDKQKQKPEHKKNDGRSSSDSSIGSLDLSDESYDI